jgi:hypothetical protein
VEELLKLIPWKKSPPWVVVFLTVLALMHYAGIPVWGIFAVAILAIIGTILILFRGYKSKAELSKGVTVKKSETGDIKVTNKSRVNVDNSSTGKITIEE